MYQAIELTGDYDPTVSNVDKNSNPRSKVLNNVKSCYKPYFESL